MPGISKTLMNPGLSPANWQKVCNDLYEHLQSITPVRTGALQADWAMKPSTNSVTFTNGMDYASYIDQGTPSIAPRDMTGQIEDLLPELASQYGDEDPAGDDEDAQREHREAREAQLPPYRR